MRDGEWACIDGELGCSAQPGEAGVESCGADAVDEDCDGAVDEGLACCDEPGAERPCGAAIGVCVVGREACGVDHMWSACSGRAAQTEESCNGLDDDCDGAVDEGLGNLPDLCDPAGLDDDCDGVIDEDAFDAAGRSLGEPCSVGLGACEAEGVMVCGADGIAVCDAEPGMARAPGVDERACNGVDDDCDGRIDESPPCNGLEPDDLAEIGDLPRGWVGMPDDAHHRGTDDEAIRTSRYESPHHVVELTRPITVSKTEVTQRQYVAVMGVNPSLHVDPADPSRYLDWPVERVSWWESVYFANALSVHDGLIPCYRLLECTPEGGIYEPSPPQAQVSTSTYRCGAIEADLACDGYRLPTDAEWEAFSRARPIRSPEVPAPAADARLYWFGDDPAEISRHEHCAVQASAPFQVASVQSGSNPFGLFDTAGNVREWVFDVLAEHPEPGPDGLPVRDPVVEAAAEPEGRRRVIRGGHFTGPEEQCRLTARDWDLPTRRMSWVGLRLVRSLR